MPYAKKAVISKHHVSQIGDDVVTLLQQRGKPVDLLFIGLFLSNFLWL